MSDKLIPFPPEQDDQEDISSYTLAVILNSKILNEYFGDDPDGQAEAFAGEDPVMAEIFQVTKAACIQQAGKRNAHTLKRLKRKGYYAKSLKSLACVMEQKAERESGKKGFTTNWPALQMFFEVAVNGLDAYGGRYHDFTKEEWEFAIEFGVLLARPDEFVDPSFQTFAPLLDDCIPYIWLCLLLKHAVNEVELRNSALEAIEEAGDMAGTIMELHQQLEREQEKNAAAVKNAAAAKAAWDTERDKARRELLRVEHEKDAQLVKMTRLVDTLQDEIGALSQRFQEEEVAPADECPKDSDSVVFSDQETQMEPLPEKGVLFLGGHPNLIGKLKPLHPGWTYINATDCAKPEAGLNTRIVFVWPNYLSHALLWRVYASLPEDVHTIFLTASNLQRLEREMQEGYQKMLKKPRGE